MNGESLVACETEGVVLAYALQRPSQKGNTENIRFLDRMDLLWIVVKSPLYKHKGVSWVWSLSGPYHVIGFLVSGYDILAEPEQY